MGETKKRRASEQSAKKSKRKEKDAAELELEDLLFGADEAEQVQPPSLLY